MNSIIIIPPVPKSEPSRCPHCKEILPEPEVNKAAMFVAILILAYVLASIATFFGELSLSEYEKCKPLGTKRWHYIFPAPALGCIAGRWLDNEDQIFKD